MRTIRCTWPHAWMTFEEDRALAQAIAPHTAAIRGIACWVARGDELLVPDYEQEARLLLWSWGTDRILETADHVLYSAVTKQMLLARRRERRASGGGRRWRVHLAPWSSNASNDK